MGSRRLLITLASLGATCFVAVACSDLPDVVPGCGNDVVEPALGEDCDEATATSKAATDDPQFPARCARDRDPNACHYVHDSTHHCPTGYVAGKNAADLRCRRPSGQFDIASEAILGLQGHSARLADFDADGQLDVLIEGGLFSQLSYLEKNGSRYVAVHAPSEPPGAALIDFDGDRIEDVARLTPDGRGIVVDLHEPDRTTQSQLFPSAHHGSALRYVSGPSRASGPTDTSPSLLAVYVDPTLTECGGDVCACIETDLGCKAPVALPWFQAGDLPGMTWAKGTSGVVLGVSGLPTVRYAPSPLALTDQTATAIDLQLLPSPKSLVLRDLDQDGVEDLGGALCVSIGVTWWKLPGPASGWTMASHPDALSPSTVPIVAGCPLEGGGPAFGSVDSNPTPDGVFSGVVTTPGPSRLPLLSLDEGEVPRVFPLDNAFNGRTCTRHAIGDFNGDGYDDLVFACMAAVDDPSSGLFEIVLGGATPSFLPFEMVTGAPIKQLVIDDFDGDGVRDIIAAVGKSDLASCGDAPDDILVAYGRALVVPDPPVRVGRFPHVEQLVAERLPVRDFSGATTPSLDIVVTGQCPEGRATSAVIHGDSHRRPFSPLLTHLSATEDLVPTSLFSGESLSEAVGATSSLVLLGAAQDRSTHAHGVPEGVIVPLRNGVDLLDASPITIAFPNSTFETPAGYFRPTVYAPDPAHAGRFFLVGSDEPVPGPEFSTSMAHGQVAAMQLGQIEPSAQLLLPKIPLGTPIFSTVTLTHAGVTTLAIVATSPMATDSVFYILHLDSDGHFREGDPVPVSLPAGSNRFVGVAALDAGVTSTGIGPATEDTGKALLVATDAGVFRVQQFPRTSTTSATLGFETILLDDGITAIAVGDISGDGLDDIFLVDGSGGRVVPQLDSSAVH